MSEKGLVIKVDGGKILVTISSLSNCGSCKACDAYKRPDMTIEIENKCNASVGDYVLIDMGRTILTGSVVFYIIPIVTLTFGILLGLWVAPNFAPQYLHEPLAAIIGISLLLAYCLFIRLATPFIKNRSYSPKVTSIIQSECIEE